MSPDPFTNRNIMRRGGRLGLWMCIALIVGNMIGSGVFLLPAALAPFGLNSIIGWAFTAGGAIALAIVFAQLSRAVPAAGGPYVYPRAAFGELTGFVVAWGYWVAVWAGNAAIATGSVSYLSELIPSITRVQGASAIVTVIVVWLLTGVNCWGVRATGWVQSVTTVMKLMPLMAVVGLGLVELRSGDLSHLASVPLSLSGTTAAATLTLWAMLGLESATIPAEKVDDPARTIPRATLVGTVITALICAAACSFVMLMVPAARLGASNAPFADAVRGFWGDRSASILAVCATISGLGALNGWILLQGELPYAMAREGVFPRIFARESSNGTPVFALAFSSVLVTGLVLMNFNRRMVDVFTFVILLATCATLVTYLVCSLALLELIRRGKLGARRGKTPWLAAVGALATSYSLWAIAGAGSSAVGWGVVLFLAGLPVFALMRAGILKTQATSPISDGSE
jgi:APA family basic amino acid/polyamine antiporter